MSIRPHYIYYPLYRYFEAATVGEAIKKAEASARENGTGPRKIGIYKLIAVIDVDVRITVEPVDGE